jgi:cytochrome c oxidase assembly protein subunit 11
MTPAETRQSGTTRARLTALACVGVVAGMVGLSYAAVPLYRLFCQVTGYGGTTRIATVAPDRIGARVITVRFDGNVAPGLAWKFMPEQKSIEVRVGETALAYYRALNVTGRSTAGTATFNVTPLQAGAYFNKIDCFCFSEQTLMPGQSADMPVSFFVDPAIEDDPDLRHVTTITLSYTFFASDPPDDLALDAGARAGQAKVN